MRLTEDERDLMNHALGIGRGENRNFYAAGGADISIWDGLVSKGLASRRRPNPIFPDPCFSVTEAGRLALTSGSKP